jgi:hypothetical protein
MAILVDDSAETVPPIYPEAVRSRKGAWAASDRWIRCSLYAPLYSREARVVGGFDSDQRAIQQFGAKCLFAQGSMVEFMRGPSG